ncbi:MAG: tyrosine--tRNA ligase [Leptospiraceae bacterium]|nr:tyrosine--tRNA ligase [Leptospiraceae bacterium]
MAAKKKAASPQKGAGQRKSGQQKNPGSLQPAVLSKAGQAALDLIKRGAVDVLPENELIEKLIRSEKSGQPLRIKAGFDPTAPDLHLGHTVLLRKLRHFQELGHQVLFLIGDMTGMIGDPTGRNATRKQLTRAEVAQNAKTYERQVFKVLDRDKTEIVFNSSWLEDMGFDAILGLTARYTVAQLLERDDFQKRYRAGDSISLIEFMYPLMQGYDSVAMQSDVELGGTDQKFNLLVGRALQKEYNQEQQVVLTMPLLVGLDGEKKMSKSMQNYIGIDESPYDMFAKLMSISDALMRDYYLYLTDIPITTIDERISADPFEAKKLLAIQIVNDFHPAGAGESARQSWESEKSARGKGELVLPPDVPVLQVTASGPRSVVQLIIEAKMAKSTSEVRRLIQQGAVKLGESLDTVSDVDAELDFPGDYVLRIGKKRYLKLTGPA